uniref:Formimidoyltetrahydrofolate cyclodeaminase n=1 Tax=Ammonifex degensii TaxID=42838 RepID=A0A7C2E3G9_9THEO
MAVFDWSIRQFLKEAASSAPTPGGGSTAALCGALAAAMASMVASLTVGKEKYKDVEPEMKAMLEKTGELLARFEELVAGDIEAFNGFMAVYKLPKDTEEEKAERARRMQEALVKATDTPLAIAGACLEVLELAEQAALKGNKGAVSDAGVATYLAEAALNAALLNVDINVPSIKDAAYVEKALAKRQEFVRQAAAIKERSLQVVHKRLTGS